MARIKIEDLSRSENVETRALRSLAGGSLVSPLSLLGARRRQGRGGPLFRLGITVLRLALA
ncbi:MAG: hypothetical protein HY720_21120 [Planctomycetes bacterium]|nr:hypothetical protein [Planctomycetota bacterium]